MLGILGPACIALALGVVPLGRRSDAAVPSAAVTHPAPPQPNAADDAPADLLLTTGFSAFNEGRHADAAQALGRFLALYGASPEATAARPRILPMLVASLLATKHPTDALPHIDDYLQRFPDGESIPDMRLWLGIAKLYAGDAANARVAFDAFLRAHPSHPQSPHALFLSAVCAQKEGNLGEAETRFAEIAASSHGPDAERAALLQLHCQIGLGRDDAAIQLLESIRGRNPPPRQQTLLATLSLALGDRLLANGDAANAWRCLLFVPTRARILSLQEENLARIGDGTRKQGPVRAAAADAARAEQDRAALLAEKAAIESAHDFDAARLLRLAHAAMALGRFRESSIAAHEAAAAAPDGPTAPVASYLALAACAEARRWRAVVDRQQVFAQRYPKDPRIPRAAFLAAHARLELGDRAAAQCAFLELARDHPDFEEADRALFLAGYSALMLQDNSGATEIFERLRAAHPTSPLAEQAMHWRAMAAVFAKDHALAISRFEEYLAGHPSGTFKEEALYRIAAARYAMRQRADARKALARWLKDFGGHPLTDEARALYGDACLASGDIDEGIAAYRAIGEGQPTLHQYAQFQIGKALRLSERFAETEAHFRAFIDAHPTSPRLAEAYDALALALRKLDRAHEAPALYRAAIERLGDDPTNRSVEPILLACAKLHKDPGDRMALEHDLSTLAARARCAGRRTLAARCAWLLGRLARKARPESTHATFLGLARDVPPDLLPPAIAIEIAEHLSDTLCGLDAEPLLRFLACRTGTPECPRALAALGLAAASRGDTQEALAIFETFEQDGTASTLLPRILETHADILIGQARHAEAVPILERLLKSPGLKGAAAARALCRIGEAQEALGQFEKAMPYYQRVYVMYGGHPDPAAKAYLASARIFERLKLWESARKTYEEFLGRDDLASHEEYALARERLQSIP